eukprot:jgi/Undpi1/7625/HiC_scaffold_23.g10098.m1
MYVSYPIYFPGQYATDGRLQWYATASTKDLIMTAEELYNNQDASMSDFDAEGLSVTVLFTSDDFKEGSMTSYLVRGMAYATVKYESFTPEVSTIHAMLTVNGKAVSDGNHTSTDGRFMLELNDGNRWILYSSDVSMALYYVPAQPNEPNKLRANVTFNCTLRAALVPYDEDNTLFAEAVTLLDAHAGSYPIKGEAQAWINSTDNKMGSYDLSWYTAGNTSVELLHYALAHHQDLLSSEMMTGVFLSSPTKGDMQLVIGNKWNLVEDALPDFDWVPAPSTITSEVELEWIEYYLELEIADKLENVAGTSVYFGAKNLMAYAQLCLVASQIGR